MRSIHNSQFIINNYESVQKKLAKAINYALCIMSCALLMSCDHKELCYEHEHKTKLTVVYDWSEAPDANPAGMCVFFYSTDRAGEYHRFDFPNAKGGDIELPEGNYTLITYNNDTEAVQFSDTNDFDGHKAFTRDGDILEPMYGNGVTSSATDDLDERVVITPDGLWGCSATDIRITEHGVIREYVHGLDDTRADGDTEDQVITLRPTDKLCHYSYEVRNVRNGKYISKISGSLSGMSGAMNMKDESLDSEPVTLPVPGQVNGAGDKVTGSFLTFGHNPSNGKAHKMAFYVVMDDGGKYVYRDMPNLDVTQQVDTAADRRHVHIIIDGLDLPTPMKDGGEFTPTVDEWGVTEEDLKI